MEWKGVLTSIFLFPLRSTKIDTGLFVVSSMAINWNVNEFRDLHRANHGN